MKNTDHTPGKLPAPGLRLALPTALGLALIGALTGALACPLPQSAAAAEGPVPTEQPSAHIEAQPAPAVTDGTAAPPAGHPAIAQSEPAQSEVKTILPAELVERYGIQITQIGVTAAGGLVDLRYKVLDPNKARDLLGDPAKGLSLIVADSGLKLMPSQHMMRSTRVQAGALSYLLFPNVRGAVQPGKPLSVAFGDLRVGPLTAQ